MNFNSINPRALETRDATLSWLARARSRLIPALAALGGTGLPFAEGALTSGWSEVVLVALVGWCLVISRPGLGESLLLSLVVLCVTVALLDLSLRPIIGPRLHFTPTNIFTRRLPELPLLGRFNPNVTFTGEGYGDIAAIVGDSTLRERRRIELRTDAAGFRNDPGASDRPIDVVVLGDSFGAGWGVTQGRIFARLLETRYGRRVYNLSFPASPWEEYLNFAIESPRLTLAEHAVLIWALYAGNDIYEPYGTTWDPAALPWNGRIGAWMQRCRTFRGRSPFRQLSRGLLRRWQGGGESVIQRKLGDGRSMLFSTANNDLEILSRTDVERHPNFPKLEQTLVAMRALTGRLGVDVVILILPTKGAVYRWVLNERTPRPEDAEPSGFAMAVLGVCERNRLECIDTKPVLVEEGRRLWESEREFLWWLDDSHLNERGHEAVATFIAVHVLGMGSEARR